MHLVLEQRLGPSAEMVMIDRMFIQEEKVALSQDRVLAKEKPGNDQALRTLGFIRCSCVIFHLVTIFFGHIERQREHFMSRVSPQHVFCRGGQYIFTVYLLLICFVCW